MSLPIVNLRPREEKRIKAGHLWIYSNEIDTREISLKSYQAGELVQVVSANGQKLGIGYINPHNLLCVRLLTRNSKASINKTFFVRRIERAKSLRELVYDKPFYRAIYGESDGLPGLIVDRYGEHLVAQITSIGMENLKSLLIDALREVYQPQSLLLRNDCQARRAENLSGDIEQAFGHTPERLLIEENATQFSIDPWRGQKTGWFYDHRPNRQQIAALAQGKRVLDVFSYLGAFGVHIAHRGASEVWCVDISASALERLHENAALNGVGDRITSIEGDAFKALNELHQAAEKFDLVVVDPPAFIKKKKDHKQGLNAYQRINQAALRLLNKDGVILSASCSMHLQRDELLEAMNRAALNLDRSIQIMQECQQGADHPLHPAIPETRYIKGFIGRIGEPATR